jgi:hypothetical protein
LVLWRGERSFLKEVYREARHETSKGNAAMILTHEAVIPVLTILGLTVAFLVVKLFVDLARGKVS